MIRKVYESIWYHRSAIGLIVFVLCLVAGLQIYHQNRLEEAHRAAIVICDTSNALRDSLNVRAGIQRDFWKDAANARAKSAWLAVERGDKRQAAIDKTAAKNYRANVKAYRPLRRLNCDASYAHGSPIYEHSKKLSLVGK